MNIETLFVQVLSELLMLLVVVLAGFAVAVLKKYLGTEKMKQINEELKSKQEIVDTVVLFVQQVYGHYEGEKKFVIALETASEWLTSKGIKVTVTELRSLIESSVKLLKTEFGEEWYKVTEEVDDTPVVIDTPKEPLNETL